MTVSMVGERNAFTRSPTPRSAPACTKVAGPGVAERVVPDILTMTPAASPWERASTTPSLFESKDCTDTHMQNPFSYTFIPTYIQ